MRKARGVVVHAGGSLNAFIPIVGGNGGVLARWAPKARDLGLQAVNVEENVGLSSQFVGNHGRLRLDGRDDGDAFTHLLQCSNEICCLKAIFLDVSGIGPSGPTLYAPAGLRLAVVTWKEAAMEFRMQLNKVAVLLSLGFVAAIVLGILH